MRLTERISGILGDLNNRKDRRTKEPSLTYLEPGSEITGMHSLMAGKIGEPPVELTGTIGKYSASVIGSLDNTRVVVKIGDKIAIVRMEDFRADSTFNGLKILRSREEVSLHVK